ncbi:NINE protein [Halarchaeum salinum]|uniref:TM2 domain-containing protein n=1 Tax=Halarchaeum salinum TaxID=489912 RepID=A0AAV3S5M2_9EURY
MKHCINCGEKINENAEVCTECGVNQNKSLEGAHDERSENEKYCVECGALINRQAEVCPKCGVPQPTLDSESNSSDQVTVGILALLLGGIGAHKFYQGNTKLGIIYLCFCWTLIPGILAFIEGILILTADEEKYERKFADGSLLGR